MHPRVDWTGYALAATPLVAVVAIFACDWSTVPWALAALHLAAGYVAYVDSVPKGRRGWVLVLAFPILGVPLYLHARTLLARPTRLGSYAIAAIAAVGLLLPRAAATMLERLALWYQRPLSVVLCADDREHGSALELCDALGFGRRTLHYDIGIALHPMRRRRRQELRGLGDFRDLRQLALPGVLR